VPDGFVITTDAYRTFVDAAALTEWLSSAAEAAPANDPAALETRSATIRERFAAVPCRPTSQTPFARHIRISINRPSPFDRQPPPKTFPISFAGQQRRSSTLSPSERCSMPSCAAGAACGRRGRSATDRATGLDIATRAGCRRSTDGGE
jgi:hypothetical protein